MEHEKEFYELLHPFKSEETKKARRNVSLVAFVVLAALFTEINVTDLKVLGADLSQGAEAPVLALGIVLLGYWLVMFLLSHEHDKEIQKERERRLNLETQRLKDRLKRCEETLEKTGGKRAPDDYGDVKSALDALKAMEERTARAARFGSVIAHMELFVPIGLSVAAAIVLVVGVVRAL